MFLPLFPSIYCLLYPFELGDFVGAGCDNVGRPQTRWRVIISFVGRECY